MIGERWGVTDDEIDRPYPCDEWATDPQVSAWRAVTIEAGTERVWPWVAQIQLAPYSYDWIDNLGRRSPQTLVSHGEPVVGEPFTSALGGVRLGRVLSVDPGRQLTGTLSGVLISYLLESKGQTRTRLLMKITCPTPQPVAALLGPVLVLFDMVMARRQLLNIKQLAERSSPIADPHIEMSVGEDAIPAPIRNLITFEDVDYIDLYTATVSKPLHLTPEQWARSVLEDAPLSRRSARLLWRAIGLRLGPSDSDLHVQGWRIVGRSESWLRCATSSPQLKAQALFIVDGTQLSVCVALHYDRRASATAIWRLVAGPHQQSVPIMMRQALA